MNIVIYYRGSIDRRDSILHELKTSAMVELKNFILSYDEQNIILKNDTTVIYFLPMVCNSKAIRADLLLVPNEEKDGDWFKTVACPMCTGLVYFYECWSTYELCLTSNPQNN